MKETIETLIETAIRQQDKLLPSPIDTRLGADTPLYSSAGSIDSLTLVSILVDLETLLQENFNAEIRLADTSDLLPEATPFASVGHLTNYVYSRLSALSV